MVTQSREANSSEDIKSIYLEKVLWGGYGSPQPRAKIFPAGLGFSLKTLLLPFTSTKQTKKRFTLGAAKLFMSSKLALISTLARRSFPWWLLIEESLTSLKSLELLSRFEDYTYVSLLKAFLGPSEVAERISVKLGSFTGADLHSLSHRILAFSPLAQATTCPGVCNSALKLTSVNLFRPPIFEFNFILVIRFQAGFYFFWTKSSSP